MQNKTIIYTTNAHAAGLGVYKSDEQEFIVSVFKKAGRSTYSYTINGTDMHRYCVEAHEAWSEVMEFLGCDIVVADKKTMKTFDIYKEAVNLRAEVKRAKKQDKLKLETQDEDQNYPRVFGLD